MTSHKRQKWYNRLIGEGLFSENAREKLDGRLIVCNHNNSGTRLVRMFSVFNNSQDFYQYQSDIDYQYKTFLEVILGEVKQKQHFDVDITADMLESFGIKKEEIAILKHADEHQRLQLQKMMVTRLPGNEISEILAKNQPPITSPPDEKMLTMATKLYDMIVNTILEQIIESIHDEYLSRGFQLTLDRNFAIYTSHSYYKRSFHIIIDGYCHNNNLECKMIYECVAKRLILGVAKFVDSKVYSGIQQFRLLHNQKPGSNRPKKVLTTFKDLFGDKSREVSIDMKLTTGSVKEFQRSLITYTADCKLFNLNLSVDSQGKSKNMTFIGQELSEIQVDKSLELLPAAGYPDGSVIVEKVEGVFIILRRKAPTYCRLCKRTHNSENPYLFVFYNTVYLDCRRHHENKKQCLGIIGGESLNDLIEADYASAIDNPDDAPMFITNDSKFILTNEDNNIPVVLNESKDSKDLKNSVKKDDTSLNGKTQEQIFTTLIDEVIAIPPLSIVNKSSKKNKGVNIPSEMLSAVKSKVVIDYTPVYKNPTKHRVSLLS